jgi:hypothetical protein
MNRRRFLQTAACGALVLAPARAEDAAAVARNLRRPMAPGGGLAEMLRMAVLAPNGHNTQGWRFRCAGRSIELAVDATRRTPVVDPDDHHLYVSLGAAAENLTQAGRAAGRPGDLTFGEDGRIRYDWTAAPPAAEPLADAILKRQSTRSVYDGRPLANAELNALAEAGKGEGVRLVLVTDRPRLNAIRDLVVAGNDAQMSDPAFMAELKSWLRFSERDAVRRGDGLYTAASGNPTLPGFLPLSIDRLIFDLFVGKGGEDDKYAEQMKTSAGVAVFFGERAAPRHWAAVGAAAERFLLTATTRNIRCAFVNQPVEVPRLRPALAALLGEKGLRPDLVIRFGRTSPLPFSLRRPVAEVAVFA